MALKKSNGNWYVCDPYYNINGHGHTQNPIPAEEYITYMQTTLKRRIWGAALYGNKKI